MRPGSVDTAYTRSSSKGSVPSGISAGSYGKTKRHVPNRACLDLVKRLARRLKEDSDTAQRLARDFDRDVRVIEQENEYLRRLLEQAGQLFSSRLPQQRQTMPPVAAQGSSSSNRAPSPQQKVLTFSSREKPSECDVLSDSTDSEDTRQSSPMRECPMRHHKSAESAIREKRSAPDRLGEGHRRHTDGFQPSSQSKSSGVTRTELPERPKPQPLDLDASKGVRSKSKESLLPPGAIITPQAGNATSIRYSDKERSEFESSSSSGLDEQTDKEDDVMEKSPSSSQGKRSALDEECAVSAVSRVPSLTKRTKPSKVAQDMGYRRSSQPVPYTSGRDEAFMLQMHDGRLSLSRCASDNLIINRQDARAVQLRRRSDLQFSPPTHVTQGHNGRRISRGRTVIGVERHENDFAQMAVAAQGYSAPPLRRGSRAQTDNLNMELRRRLSGVSILSSLAPETRTDPKSDLVSVTFDDDPPLAMTPPRKPNFEVLSVWLQDNDGPEPLSDKHVFTNRSIMEEGFARRHSKGQHAHHRLLAPALEKRACVMQPNAVKRLSWDILSLWLILYDFITIPLQFFDPPETAFTTVCQYVIRIFWTMDLGASFCTGYVQPDGVIEMRRKQIAARYVRTWLSLDIILVAMDWLDLMKDLNDNDSAIDSLGFARGMKTARTFRILRMTRLLRLLRLSKIISLMSERIRSEKKILVYDIGKILVMTIGATHAIACIWYGISAGNGDSTWVVVSGVREESLGLRYAMSVHWSLAHVSGFGFDEVHPQNPTERVFAILVLFATFVMAASFTSTLTSSLTRLHIVTSRESGQFIMLRRYLTENEISQDLSLRVQRNATHRLMEHQKITPEADVKLLTMVSLPLKQEMHFELHSPVLGTHAFLRHYCSVCPAVMGKVCHNAVTSRIFTSEDVCFMQGDSSEPRMYFVCQGTLEYARDGVLKKPLAKGAWCCEPTLWTTWAHRGSLRSMSECSMSVLDAKIFQEIVSQFTSPDVNPHVYAANYVATLNMMDQAVLDDLIYVQESDWLANRGVSSCRSSTELCSLKSHMMRHRFFPEFHLANPLAFLSLLSQDQREIRPEPDPDEFVDLATADSTTPSLRRTKTWDFGDSSMKC